MLEPRDDTKGSPNRPGESELAVPIYLLESVADGLVVMDREWRYSYVNAQAERQVGRPRSELLGKRLWDEFPFTVGTEVEAQLRRAAAERVICEFPGYNPAWGRWYENRACPAPDGGVAVYFRDVTDRKQAEERLRQSEALLAEAQQLAHIGSWNWHLTTGVFHWSDEHYRLFGFEPQQPPITWERAWNRVHPDDRTRIKDLVAQAIRDRRPYDCSFRLLLDDGTVRILQTRGRIAIDESGNPARMFGTSQDITERKEAERLLDSAKAFAESIVMTVRKPLLVLDRDLRILSANRSFYATFKVEPTETEGRFVYEIGDGQWDIPGLRTLLEEIIPANSWFDDFEVTHDFEHIGPKTMLLNARRFPPEGPFELLLLGIEDITGRKQAEMALRESEERFRSYFDLGLIGMAITSPTKGVLEVNNETCRILGYAKDELLQKTWAEMTHPDDLAADSASFDRVMAGEIDGYTLDKRWVRKDGQVIDTTISVKCLRRDDGSVGRFVALIQEITERKRSEAALRESERRLGAFLEQIPVGLGLCDRDGRWAVTNNILRRFYGDVIPSRDPVGALRWRCWGQDGRLLDRSQWPAARALRGETVNPGLDFLYSTGDGREIWTRISSVPFRNEDGEITGAVVVVQDIDQQKRAEEALRASEERMAGDLAAMVRLQQVSNRLVRDGDATPLLLVIVDAAMAITDADMGNIQLLDPASGTLRIVASRGFRPEALEAFKVIHLGESVCGTALERGERVVVEDVTTSPIFVGKPVLDAALAAGIRAAQSTPLIGRDGPLVGMLSTHYRAARHPADRDLHILDLLARQAADWIERTQAEASLRESEERFRNMAENAPVMIWLTDAAGACTYLNQSWCRFTGTTPEQGLGSGWLGSVHPDDRGKTDAAFRAANERSEAIRLEYRLRRHDGEYRWAIDSGAPRFGAAGEFLGYVGSVLDVTEERQVEDEIRRARDELDARVRSRTSELSAALAALERQEVDRKALLRRVVTVQEEERRRISRELHDQMGQHLTALMLRLRIAKDSVVEGSPVREQLGWLEDYAGLIGQEVHRIALELRPTALDDLGLPAALANYAEEWSRRSGVVAEVRSGGLESERLPATVETAIYRIVQEAMTNVLKHAGAGRVVITLNRLRGNVVVIVEDDGKGFDGDGQAEPFPPQSRLGLMGMKERAALAGGMLEIESVPGNGTSVLVRIPLPEAAEAEPHG